MASYPGLGCFTDEQMFEWISTKLKVECKIGPSDRDLTLEFTPFPEPAVNWMKKHLKKLKGHKKSLKNIILVPFFMRHNNYPIPLNLDLSEDIKWDLKHNYFANGAPFYSAFKHFYKIYKTRHLTLINKLNCDLSFKLLTSEYPEFSIGEILGKPHVNSNCRFKGLKKKDKYGNEYLQHSAPL